MKVRDRRCCTVSPQIRQCRPASQRSSSRNLFGYLDTHSEVPPISLERVMAAAGLIEAMGRRLLPLRTPRRGPVASGARQQV